MTNIFSNSSFFFMKKYNIEPIIKHDPRGICLLELSFLRKYNTHPKIAANKRIMLKENGPKILHNPPYRIKSPPPIPSFL